MERYRAGAFAEAIVIWETIYRELGAEKGYRLAFNLARAYEQFNQETTSAAQYYEAYLKETKSRHEAGEMLEPLVLKQETEAKERLAELAATKGRIRVTSDRKIWVKIDEGTERLTDDFVGYVTPGRHVVSFNPGTREEQKIEREVALGQQIDISPAKEAAPPPSVTVAPHAARFETREDRPFGATTLYVAAGIAALSVTVPILFYVKAGNAKDDYDAATQRTRDEYDHKVQLGADYKTAQSNAYASLAVPIVLGVVTLGLGIYYLAGTKERRIPLQGALRAGALRF
jgi:hypothetical protein